LGCAGTRKLLIALLDDKVVESVLAATAM